ncbi:UPF0280 protein [Trichinella spiralis]|uniref:UPF0280 protein n=1 Tax=Trichinella spiralis TaxID=6334 RepID=A0ABR3KZA3_TRISP
MPLFEKKQTDVENECRRACSGDGLVVCLKIKNTHSPAAHLADDARTGKKTAKPKAAVLKRRRTTATTYQTTPRTRRSMPSAIASVTGVNVKKQTPSESSSSSSAQKNAH